MPVVRSFKSASPARSKQLRKTQDVCFADIGDPNTDRNIDAKNTIILVMATPKFPKWYLSFWKTLDPK